jgi:hypothetical protein
MCLTSLLQAVTAGNLMSTCATPLTDMLGSSACALLHVPEAIFLIMMSYVLSPVLSRALH